jgi:adenylate cyclase
VHSVLWVTPLGGDYLQDEVREEAHQLARKAVQLDPNLPQAHAQLAWVSVHKGESDAAMAAMSRAIELNPNYIDYRFAAVLIQAGRAARAIETLQAYRRLDPFYPSTMPGWLGFAYYVEQEYADALSPLRECVSRAPSFRFGHVWLAVTYVRLGRLEEARAEAAQCLRLDPVLTIATQRRLGFFKSPLDTERFLEDLREAGFPEH